MNLRKNLDTTGHGIIIDAHKFNDALTVVGFKRLLFQVDKEIFQCFADVSIGKYIHVIFLESLDVFVFFRTPAGEDDE